MRQVRQAPDASQWRTPRLYCAAALHSRTALPYGVIPAVGSYSRCSSAHTVVLPLPLRPTCVCIHTRGREAPLCVCGHARAVARGQAKQARTKRTKRRSTSVKSLKGFSPAR
jgi:hypothetical protein